VWWPHGHIIGWEHTFVHEIRRFFEAIVAGGSVAPEGADFEDGYRASVVADAIMESSRTRRHVDISYG
jgi:predicted dehydrogenase